MTIPLSVLDLVPVGAGFTSRQALDASLELARHVEQLGYVRLWYAEHHNMPSIASTTPDVLITRAGAVTSRIRLGSGGVMLPNHAPLRIAETYRLLEALYPGRIDLGLGRAPGTDRVTALALRRSPEAVLRDDFQDQLAELLAFGRDEIPADHAFHAIKAYPDDAPLPPVWLLGSSDYSARLSARLGMPFAYAAHFSPSPPEPPMLAYRQGFRPGDLPAPHAILAVSAVVADTDAEAQRLASSMQLAWVRLRTGRMAKLPTPEEALAYPYTDFDREVVRSYAALTFVGTPDDVMARVRALARRTQADEVMVTTIVHDPVARRRSYELLAKAWS